MKPVKLLTAVLGAACLLIACNNSANAPVDKTEVQAAAIADVQEIRADSESENQQHIPTGNQLPGKPLSQQPVSADTATNHLPQPVQKSLDWNRKIIKTATLNLEVRDFKQYNSSVHQVVSHLGGYIAQEEQHFADERIGNSIVIKVPVERFDEMMTQLPVADAKIIERKISSEDVTGQVVDVQARLDAKRQMRLRYLELLKQSKNMEEILQVQGEINSLQEEMEAAAGRVKYLTYAAAMSTINLDFYQRVTGFKPDSTEPSFFTRLIESLRFGGQWILELVLGIAGLWPLWILLASGMFIYKKRGRNKKLPA